MQTLKNNENKALEQLVSLNQSQLHKVLYSFLKNKYSTVVSTEDGIYAIGDIPIALVAHMDTVFKSPVKNFYYDIKKNTVWSPEGLGADDRAGIFIILQILKSGMRPSVILTRDEEIGCCGAFGFSQMPCPFKDLKYLIELDRRGSCDCVFYDCVNEEFIDYVESFGFIEDFGSFSDISALCPEWGICGVNLSVGYENEHEKIETLNIGVVFKTIEKVKKMLSQKDIPDFKYKEAPYSMFKSLMPTEDSYFKVKCSKCGRTFSDFESIPAKGLNGKVVFYCPDCAVNKISWCSVCGEAFEVDPTDTTKHICKDCENKIKGAI